MLRRALHRPGGPGWGEIWFQTDPQDFQGWHGALQQLLVQVVLAGRMDYEDAAVGHRCLRPGSLILRIPQRGSRASSPAGCATCFCLFDRHSSAALVAAGLIDTVHPVHERRPATWMRTSLDGLWRAWPRAETAHPSHLLLQQILALLGRWRIPDGGTDPAGESAAAIQQAAVLLTRDVPGPVDTRALGRAVGLSPVTLRRRFRSAYGCSPRTYRLRHRLQQAAELLETGLAVKAVADRLGYCSPYELSRQFSKHMGCAPRDWA